MASTGRHSDTPKAGAIRLADDSAAGDEDVATPSRPGNGKALPALEVSRGEV
jgi:hypothetical protein